MKSRISIAMIGLVLLAGHLFSACDHPADFPQFSRDRVMAYGLFYSSMELFDFTLSQRPMGEHNFDTSCPQGGTVHVEGTTQVDGTVAVDILYDMKDCRFNSSFAFDGLVLDGKLQHTANYDAAGLGGEDLFSENLQMEGTLFGGPDQTAFKQQCDIEISYIESDISITLLGLICGRDVGISLWHVTGEEE